MTKDAKERQRIKAVLKDFMREHYTDEKLRALLAHAEAGKLAYISCCCFVGIPSADHELKGKHGSGTIPDFSPSSHLVLSELKTHPADKAYCFLATTDEVRRKRLIPLIKEEMKRRNML